MRSKLKHPIFIFMMLLFLLLLLPGYRTEAAAVEVKLNKTAVTLYTNGTVKLKATVTSSNKKAAWSSSNKKVAAVSSSGKVTAKTTGTATITAKVAGKAAKCKVTVKEKTDAGAPSVAGEQTAYWYLKEEEDGMFRMCFFVKIPVKNAPSNPRITSVECFDSNSIYKIDQWGLYMKNGIFTSLWMTAKTTSTPKASENVTIRFNIARNGKTYKLSSKITVKQLPDDFIKSLKVGSKEYAPYFKNKVRDVFLRLKIQLNILIKE